MNPLSCYSSNKIASPSLPYLAVLPDLWIKKLGSWGGSNWMTKGTSSKSNPLANTSVVNKITLFVILKLLTIFYLFFYAI